MDPERRKRINLYKKIIVTTVLLSVLIPLVLCIVLLGQVCSLKSEIESLNAFQSEYYEDIQKEIADVIANQTEPEVSTTPTDSALLIEDETTPAGNDKSQSSIIETPPAMQDDKKPIVMSAENDTSELTSEAATFETATEETTTVDTRKKVYLTFDDGPSANTEAILDILKEYNAKATFFVNGKEGYDDTYRRIVEEGHTLAMHSYTHKYNEIYSSVEAFMEDMQELREYLYEITGVMCDIYRFPGGSSNTISKIDMREFGKALAEEGIVYFDWNVESRDAVSPARPAAEIYTNVTSGVVKKKTPVVLMHDMLSKKTTVEALPGILQFLIDNDYNVTALDSSVDVVQHVKIEKN